ncbi:hypothetical protein HN011_006286 [Eciton burchellii]|nr:hypothetical protein HN011_006286 [Eciton burchellii]
MAYMSNEDVEAAVVKRGRSHGTLCRGSWLRLIRSDQGRSKRSYPDRIRVIDGSNLPRVRDRKSTLQRIRRTRIRSRLPESNARDRDKDQRKKDISHLWLENTIGPSDRALRGVLSRFSNKCNLCEVLPKLLRHAILSVNDETRISARSRDGFKTGLALNCDFGNNGGFRHEPVGRKDCNLIESHNAGRTSWLPGKSRQGFFAGITPVIFDTTPEADSVPLNRNLGEAPSRGFGNYRIAFKVPESTRKRQSSITVARIMRVTAQALLRLILSYRSLPHRDPVSPGYRTSRTGSGSPAAPQTAEYR